MFELSVLVISMLKMLYFQIPKSRCTQVLYTSRSFPIGLHSTSPSSEIKMAHWGCEIKMMALKAPSSWSSQNQPYGPLGSVLFLHSVLSNMLREIRVQPASLSAVESTALWSTTGIHPACSHSNNLGLMCSAWNDQEGLFSRLLPHTFVSDALSHKS